MILYLFVGFLAALYTFGTMVAYFKAEHPSIKQDKMDYAFYALISVIAFVTPITAAGSFFMSDFNKHGWRIK